MWKIVRKGESHNLPVSQYTSYYHLPLVLLGPLFVGTSVDKSESSEKKSQAGALHEDFKLEDFKYDYKKYGEKNFNVQIPHLERLAAVYLQRARDDTQSAMSWLHYEQFTS